MGKKVMLHQHKAPRRRRLTADVENEYCHESLGVSLKPGVPPQMTQKQELCLPRRRLKIEPRALPAGTCAAFRSSFCCCRVFQSAQCLYNITLCLERD